MAPQVGGRLVEVGVGALAWVQHGEQEALELAAGSLVESGRCGWSSLGEEQRVGVDALLVVEVQEASDASADLGVGSNAGARVEAGCCGGAPSRCGSAAVDVVEFETRLVEVVGERRVAEIAQLLDPLPPGGGKGFADVAQDDVASDVVEVEVAAGGQVGEALLDVGLQLSPGAAEHPPVAEVEAELLGLVADEVQDGEDVLAFGAAQASTELLEEDGGALGRAQHEYDVDGGDVDALVEQVDGEQDLHTSVAEVVQCLASLIVGRVRRDRS